MDEARRPLLRELDKNSDAIKIRISDLKDTLVAMGIEPTSEELEDMMKKLNKNVGDDDGYIKMEELLEYYEENNVAWKRLKKDLKKKSLWLAKMMWWFGREFIWLLFLDILGYAFCIYQIREDHSRRKRRSQQKSADPSPTSSSSVGASPS